MPILLRNPNKISHVDVKNLKENLARCLPLKVRHDSYLAVVTFPSHA
jgi:hypothetical protein